MGLLAIFGLLLGSHNELVWREYIGKEIGKQVQKSLGGQGYSIASPLGISRIPSKQ